MWYTLYRLYSLSIERGKPMNLEEEFEHDYDITSIEKKKRNCSIESHSCLTTNDCTQICNDQYTCNTEKFLCEPFKFDSTPTTQQQPSSSDKCDPTKGFLNTISVSEIFGERFSCVNTLPAYYQENGEFWPHVCNGGTFNPDPDAGYGQYMKCKCPPDHTLVLKSTHPAPRCIKTDSLGFYPSYYKV